MQKPSKKVVLVAVHFILQFCLLVYIWVKVDWSVAVFLFWFSISLASFNDKIVKWGNGLKARVDEVDDKQTRSINEFNTFVSTINSQAMLLKKEMNVCRECEMHGMHGVRPGSIHNRQAPNCVMNQSGKISTI